jgi:S-adenosylmethionine:tRNA ribosyltransferase-isomerase
MVIDAQTEAIADRNIRDLPRLLSAGDLLVLNDAATFPGSIHATTIRGDELELRLVTEVGDKRWRAVIFGSGDWRTPTEHRPPPPALREGLELELAGDIRARVVAISPLSPRLVDLELSKSGDAFWATIYAFAKPIQYSYLARDLAIDEVQTGYANRPWAAEPPSAGIGLPWSTLLELKRRKIEVATLTHAAGLSATGDDALDRALPLAERYHLSESTVAKIAAARRIIAAGTTVVRALEGAARKGPLTAGEGTTDLKISGEHELQIVDAIITGVHEPTGSHYALLEAFAPRTLLEHASIRADALGYLGHELGDGWLIFGKRRAKAALSPRRFVERGTFPRARATPVQ